MSNETWWRYTRSHTHTYVYIHAHINIRIAYQIYTFPIITYLQKDWKWRYTFWKCREHINEAKPKKKFPWTTFSCTVWNHENKIVAPRGKKQLISGKNRSNHIENFFDKIVFSKFYQQCALVTWKNWTDPFGWYIEFRAYCLHHFPAMQGKGKLNFFAFSWLKITK